LPLKLHAHCIAAGEVFQHRAPACRGTASIVAEAIRSVVREDCDLQLLAGC